MHIGLLSPGWPVDLFPNGIVTYVYNLRTALLSQGHRVSVFCTAIGTHADKDIHWIRPSLKRRILRRIRGSSSYDPYDFPNWGQAIAATVNAVHRTDPIDVLEMEEFWGWCGDVQAGIPVPVVVKLHGPAFLSLVEEDRHTEHALKRIDLEGDGLRRVTSIIAPSQSTLDSIVEHYRLTPRIRKVVPNPVIPPQADQLWDLDRCDQKSILFVGRFDKPKGGDIALIAFQKLLKLDPDLKLIFVGPDKGITANDGRQVFFEEFRNSLLSESQRANVRYLGSLPLKDVFELRPRAMVTLVTSHWENQPNTALEAMIQGCPVVAYDTGGVGEIIEDGKSGMLARPDDIDGLCDKIMLLLRDPAAARRLGKTARAAVLQRHSAEKLGAAAVDVYRQAIALQRENARD